MAEIFISYRREDSHGHANKIFSYLRQELGDSIVFLDTSMNPGEVWERNIKSELKQSTVLIALIGKKWITPRLRDPNDYVRREIATALSDKKIVIPVIVDGASLPSSTDLPEAIRSLHLRQAFWLSNYNIDAYLHDLKLLQKNIVKSLNPSTLKPSCRIILRRLSRYTAYTLPMTVYIDNKDVGKIKNDEKKEFYVASGDHTIKISCGRLVMGDIFSDTIFFNMQHEDIQRFICHAMNPTDLSAKVYLFEDNE
jgi:hypothetical protein